MVNFKENYHFSRFWRGSNIFLGGPTFSRGGGGPTFSRGGGGVGESNCLFPIETLVTCDFPGPPPPPLDPHLQHLGQLRASVMFPQ